MTKPLPSAFVYKTKQAIEPKTEKLPWKLAYIPVPKCINRTGFS